MKKGTLVLVVERRVSSCVCTFCLICLDHQQLSIVQQYATLESLRDQ